MEAFFLRNDITPLDSICSKEFGYVAVLWQII